MKYITSVLLTILLMITTAHYLEGSKINCKIHCDSKVAADKNTDQNELLPYYPFFINI